MKLLFTNSKKRDDYLIDALEQFPISQQVSIATPFFTENEFLNILIENNYSIRLIVRLCIATSYSALKKILHQEGVTIKFFTDQHFHSKIYVLDKLFIIVGSSNFTNGGLKNNCEINVGIPHGDERFNELTSLFEEYWETAKLLTPEKLERFKDVIGNHRNDIDEMDKSITQELEDSFVETDTEIDDEIEGGDEEKKKHRSLSDEHKMKISEANKGRKHGELSDERKRALAEAASNALSKPVVCLNTGERYTSMKDAAEKFYGYTRGYGYISDVCKGNKSHYKKSIWRFEEDYKKLTESDIERLLKEVNEKFEGKEIIKEKMKMLFRNEIFDSLVGLSECLSFEGKHYNFRSISALISQYKKKNCSFFKVNSSKGEEYVYFADYFQKYLDGQIIEEEPVEKSVEELKDEYENVFDMELGDVKIVDILASDQKTFYRFEGEYYKSKSYIVNNCSYDEKLIKKYVIPLTRDKNYEFLWETSAEDIFRSSKKTYYLKNKTIFRNVSDYVEKYIKVLSKDEVLIELGILW